MSDNLTLNSGNNRQEKYLEILPQIESLISTETNLIANLANVCAALNQTFGFLWTGFYLIEKNELVLGPFQGPIACTRITKGKGVCGKVWQDAKSLVVPDVDQFPGHIACSSESKSEVVVPVIVDNQVVAVLDIDSDQLNDFSELDQRHLEQLANILARKWQETSN